MREWFTDELNRIDGIHAFRSGSNFVAVRMDGVDMEHVKEALKQQGVLIRLFEDHGEMLARIAVSNRGMMEKVVKLLRQAANQ